MAFRLNNLVERVKSKMGGIPQTLNQIGQKLTDNEGLYQRGQLTLPGQRQANQAIMNNVIKPMAQSTYNTAKPILNYLDPRGYQAERQSIAQGGNLGQDKLIGAAKAMVPTAINAVGYSKLRPAMALTSGAIGGIANKIGGGSFQEGFKSGVGASPNIAALGSLGSGIAGQVAGKFSPLVNSQIGKFAINRAVSIPQNIIEGKAINSSLGQNYGAGNLGIDALSGLAFGANAPNGKIKIKGARKTIDPQTLNEVDGLRDYFNQAIKGKATIDNRVKTDVDRIASQWLDRKDIDSVITKSQGKQPAVYYRNLLDTVAKKVGDYNSRYEGFQMGIADGKNLQPTQEINTGAYSAIDPKTGTLKVQDPRQTLRTLMGGTTDPKMSNAQTRATMGNKEPLPWETPADVLKEKKVSNFDRIMEEADQAAGFKTPQQVEEEIGKVARSVDKKVNLLDYLRTPDRVLEKIGLKNEADTLKKSYNKYLDELPKEIDKVTQWYNRVKMNEGAEKRIFRYLDGQEKNLTGEELKVAKEMQGYLEGWADKLGLPQDKRIASYITHIFDKDFIEKEFDEDLAKIISEKIPGSVYDPFLQKRLGKMGYIEDAFQALDAYVKRATRKYNMDPALEGIRKREGDLDLESWKYVKNLTDNVNLRPSDLDNLLDNFIKSTPIGYSFGGRPTASLTRGFRQMVYRATLGLNIGSAMRNLSQGANTYAKLGEKYTGVGYVKALKSILTRDNELERVGVLRDTMIQDRTLNATKKTLENMDKGLWVLFNMAEKINRGAAYYGAKSRALAKGMNEKQATQAGIDLARQTQFTFGSVDTPVALQGDIAKTALQFQSYNVKQAEFLGEMAKNKEFAGIARYIGANLAMVYTIGKLFGMEPRDMIPFFNQIQGVVTGESEDGRVPKTPLQTVATGVLSVPGVFSPDEATRRKSTKNVQSAIALTVPAGTQIKKTLQGVSDSLQGYNTSQSGRIRFATKNDPVSIARNAVFGPYNNKGAQQYFDNEMTPLGEKQSEIYKNLPENQRQAYYDKVIADRERNAQKKEMKLKIKGELKDEPQNPLLKLLNPKKTEASTVDTTDADLYIKLNELEKYYEKPPSDSLKRITFEKEKLSKAKSIFNDDGDNYPENIKKQLIEKMGYNMDDIRYDIATNLSTAERASYMVDRMKGMNESQMKQFLEDTRTKSLSDKTMGSKAVYDLLIENGYMDKATRDYLLSFEKEIDSKTRKYTKKVTKKGKKLTKLTLPKVSPVKLTPITLSKISMPKSVSTKTKLQLPNKARTMRIKV